VPIKNSRQWQESEIKLDLRTCIYGQLKAYHSVHDDFGDQVLVW